MKKIIKNLLIITLLLLFTIPLYGCASTATGPYLYDYTNYSIGNMAFTEEINVIYIDWLVGDVIIEQSQTQEIIIREDVDVKIDDTLKMHYCLNNNELDIKFCGSKSELNQKFKVKKLYVYIPINYPSLQIIVKNDSADITVKGLYTNRLYIENNSGDIDITNVVLNYLEIENKSGNVSLFYLNVKTINVKTDSGKLGLSYLKLPERAVINSNTGLITIYVSPTDSVGFQIHCITNKVKSNLDLLNGNNSLLLNKGPILFYITSEYGDIKLLKK